VKDLKRDLRELAQDYSKLQKQKDLGYLLDRVCPAAYDRLINDADFVKNFQEEKACDAFVLSIDIRRSTDLMLRAKTPQTYAEFLDAVCTKLVEEIKRNYGVVDKFTGDGLLAYFPLFFSGDDAGYRTLAVTQACHKVFAELYREQRNRFSVTLKDVGLGIGIDFGPVHFCRVTSELTVVGAPVVYACRFSGAPVGYTYMNHSAWRDANHGAQECKGKPVKPLQTPVNHRLWGVGKLYTFKIQDNDMRNCFIIRWLCNVYRTAASSFSFFLWVFLYTFAAGNRMNENGWRLN
jgi:hypothetical protein